MILDEMITGATKVVADTIDIGTAVITLGEYGEMSKENVSRLVATGITIYALSEASGVAVDIIERFLDE